MIQNTYTVVDIHHASSETSENSLAGKHELTDRETPRSSAIPVERIKLHIRDIRGWRGNAPTATLKALQDESIWVEDHCTDGVFAHRVKLAWHKRGGGQAPVANITRAVTTSDYGQLSPETAVARRSIVSILTRHSGLGGLTSARESEGTRPKTFRHSRRRLVANRLRFDFFFLEWRSE